MRLNLHRRHAARLLVLAAALASIGTAAMAHEDDDGDDNGTSLRHDKLFISTNAPASNEVLVYQRAGNAAASYVTRVATGGLGSPSGLGSQGAVTLSGNGRYLFVVNAGSNTVSTFALRRSGLELKSIVDSGGLRPISVTEHDGLVYVLNGSSENVIGFRNVGGTLVALPGGTGTLSAANGTGPAQVGFSDDGDALVVTEKNTQKITSFRVKRDGTLTQKTVTASAGAVPFGFAVTRRNVLVVSEAAASGVSSYRLRDDAATPVLATPSLANGQGAACWIAVTPDGRFAFSANAAGNTVSSYGVARDGTLSLVAAAAGSTVTGSNLNPGALDMAVSPNGRQLNVFAQHSLQIVSFTITSAGGLVQLGGVGGIPAGAAGLAAN